MPARYRIVLLVGFVLALLIWLQVSEIRLERRMTRFAREQIVLNRYVDAMLRAAHERGLEGGETTEIRENWPGGMTGTVLGEADVAELLGQVDEHALYRGAGWARLESVLLRGTWITDPPVGSGLIGAWIPPGDTPYNAVEVPVEGYPRDRR